VYSIFGAIIGHHLIEAFSFGVILNRALGIKIWWAILFFIVTYASLLPIGIGIGIGLSTQIQSVGFQLVQGFIIAIAAGAFMYVAIFEVLIGHNHFGEDDEDEAIAATAEAVIVAEEQQLQLQHKRDMEHDEHLVEDINSTSSSATSPAATSNNNNTSISNNNNNGIDQNNNSSISNASATLTAADSHAITFELEDMKSSSSSVNNGNTEGNSSNNNSSSGSGNNSHTAVVQIKHYNQPASPSIHSIATQLVATKMRKKHSDNDVETTTEKILLMVRFALFALGFALMSVVAIWV